MDDLRFGLIKGGRSIVMRNGIIVYDKAAAFV
jgi:hypothetical protein